MPFTSDISTALEDARWRLSTFTGSTGSCVAVAALTGDSVAMRNSNHPQAGTLVCSASEFSAFAASAAAGRFDDLTA